MKKVLAVMMAFALVLALCACQGTGGASATPAAGTTTAPSASASGAATPAASFQPITFPLQQESTLTIWQTFSNKLIDSMDKNPIVAEIQKRTGIKLSFKHPAAGEEATAFQLMVASKNYPDIIRMSMDYEGDSPSKIVYPGGGEKGISDGVFIKLNDLIESYAPNYKEFRARGGAYTKDTITDDGTIWAMYAMSDTTEPCWNGLVYRKDWADELGLAAPETIDDWHAMLTAFKTKKNAAAPLLIDKAGLLNSSEFLSAYGIGRDFYQVEGKVKYGFIEPAFKDYLATMKQWYSEGLIDPNFTTNADFQPVFMPVNYLIEGKTGAGVTNWSESYDALFSLFNATKDSKINFTPVAAPVLKKGDKIHFRYVTSPVLNPFAITTACKSPEIAVKLLDWCYDKDVSVMINYGEEGKTYTMVDGKPQFTDFILKNPDGNDKPTMFTAYSWEGCPGRRDYARGYQGVPEKLLSACDVWNATDTDYTMPIGLSLTTDEAAKKAKTMTDITTYATETIPQFIMGTMPLENFDSFVSQVKAMGIDSILSIEQAAMDRYNKR